MAGPAPAGDGRLLDNMMHFARVLRAAGLPVGPGKVVDAARAVEAVGLASRDDFYWTLHAVFVNRRDQRDIFDQAFHVFWRNPRLLERLMQAGLPQVLVPPAEEDRRELSRRVADAVKSPGDDDRAAREDETEVEIDAALTWSAEELLRTRDFESMSAAEVAAARRAIQHLKLPIHDVPTRRFRPDAAGPRIDLRATLRAGLRGGSGEIVLRRRRRRTRRPPLVILCDISGSMASYARMLLHFFHALTNDRDRVFTFLFGTRLTNVTRHLRHKDVDLALARVGAAAEDWSGGTRIGACLHAFNRFWSRRVLAQGAVVVLVTDGLDREGAAGLPAEMERLHKSCRRLVWLNPLLRYDAFEPKSSGIRAMLPHVDEFRPVHNLESLAALADALARPAAPGGEMTPWLKRLH
jgi:uncharacterized protein